MRNTKLYASTIQSDKMETSLLKQFSMTCTLRCVTWRIWIQNQHLFVQANFNGRKIIVSVMTHTIEKWKDWEVEKSTHLFCISSEEIDTALDDIVSLPNTSVDVALRSDADIMPNAWAAGNAHSRSSLTPSPVFTMTWLGLPKNKSKRSINHTKVLKWFPWPPQHLSGKL